MEKNVKVYDLQAGVVSEVPVTELAPGMLKARVEGIGEVWVVAAAIKPGIVYYHPPCDEDIRDLFREIKASLDEVYPLTVDEWEDGFRMDLHAEREIVIWLRVATVYRQCTAGRNLSQEERQEYFNILMACTFSTPDEVPHVCHRKYLSRRAVRDTIAAFYGQDGDKSGSVQGQTAA